MKFKFKYEDKEIEFDIVNRKRKTICIKVEENGDVNVIAPLRTKKEYIILVVKNRAQWILDKQKDILKRSSRKAKRDFSKGSTFMYLGREYPFQVFYEEERKNIVVELMKDFNNEFNKDLYFSIDKKAHNEYQETFWDRSQFIIRTNTMEVNKLKLALEKWYREETFKIVSERVAYYASNFNDKVTGIKVKEQKRRWASCTGKNVILFNWRISMAKADVIDYIVVHEMCHMDYRNHSKYFWNRVAEIMPDYKEKHDWLRGNGINMYL